MSQSSHLPDQPIMKYVHPADRRRPWVGAAVGLAALVVMLAFGVLGRNFGTLEHLKAINDAGVWLTMSLIEASAGILALLLAAVALGERIERGVEGPHFISLIRMTARGGFATIAPALLFDVLKITTTSVAREGLLIPALVVVQIALLAATIGAFAFMLSSLWATLRVTFVGVPESAPEEDKAGEGTAPPLLAPELRGLGCPPGAPRASLHPLFAGVRGRGILRSPHSPGPIGASRKVA